MRKSPLLRGKPRKKPPRTNSPSAATRVPCSTTTAKNDDALGIRFRRTPSDHEVDGCRRYARKLGYLGNRERRAALSKDSAPPPTPLVTGQSPFGGHSRPRGLNMASSPAVRMSSRLLVLWRDSAAPLTRRRAWPSWPALARRVPQRLLADPSSPSATLLR